MFITACLVTIDLNANYAPTNFIPAQLLTSLLKADPSADPERYRELSIVERVINQHIQ